MPVSITAADLGRHLPERGLCWISACSAESDAFRQGLSGLSRPDLTFVSIFVPGLNRPSYLLETGARVTTFFMVPELSRQEQVCFLPLSYRDIRAWLSANPPRVVMVMCAPPAPDGLCNFGPVTDFVAEIYERAELLIGHLNPLMPVTNGTTGIPYERFSAVIETPQSLGQSNPGTDEVAARIASHAARVIPDGATLQAGIGRIPEAIMRALTGKRDLAIHSGLIGDSTLHLLRAGALRAEAPITAGVAIGTTSLYDAISEPSFVFRSPSFTHHIATLAKIASFVSINSAIEVDLDGQVYSEATDRGLLSGPGGASDFAAGARGDGGIRIVALPSTTANGGISRIISPENGKGPVSLGRMDTDLVITEYGTADLRGLSHDARRNALIGVAHPSHRKTLAAPTHLNSRQN